MLTDTGRNSKKVKPDSHANSASGVFVIIFREINYCLVPLSLSIYSNTNGELEVSYPDKDWCHELRSVTYDLNRGGVNQISHVCREM